MELDDDQENAIVEVDKWHIQCRRELERGEPMSKPIFYLAGYAGVGKTTIAKLFRESVTGHVCYAAYTGKAALMMLRNGCYGAQTMHSLMYSVDSDDESVGEPVFSLDINSMLRVAKLLIVDECSMVNDEMGNDALSFNVPILVLGDPGQLPPVSGTGFFTRREPDILLTQVHRQALDNPIIRIATNIRNGKILTKESNEFIDIYPPTRKFPPSRIVDEYDQMITGKNVTRLNVNMRTRQYLGRESIYPEVDDRIICLRNNRQEGLLNGLLGTVDSADCDDERCVLSFTDEDERKYKNVAVHSACFVDPKIMKDWTWGEKKEFEEFDFGYAVTCHKAQGSQWNSVCLLDDGMFSWDKTNRMRWLYTAATRAEEHLAIVRTRG